MIEGTGKDAVVGKLLASVLVEHFVEDLRKTTEPFR
jgi:hypothetical protein